MKKVVLFALVIGSVFASCKKEELLYTEVDGNAPVNTVDKPSVNTSNYSSFSVEGSSFIVSTMKWSDNSDSTNVNISISSVISSEASVTISLNKVLSGDVTIQETDNLTVAINNSYYSAVPGSSSIAISITDNVLKGTIAGSFFNENGETVSLSASISAVK